MSQGGGGKGGGGLCFLNLIDREVQCQHNFTSCMQYCVAIPERGRVSNAGVFQTQPSLALGRPSFACRLWLRQEVRSLLCIKCSCKSRTGIDMFLLRTLYSQRQMCSYAIWCSGCFCGTLPQSRFGNTPRRTNTQANKRTDRDRPTDRPTDGQTHRRTDGQTHRRTNRREREREREINK